MALNGLMLKLGFLDKVTRESSLKNLNSKNSNKVFLEMYMLKSYYK